MAFKSKRKEQDDPKLDMTPMIDVVFQLMIFFVVTLKQEDIYSMLLANAPAPNSNSTPDANAPEPVKIDLGPVDASGTYAHMTWGSMEIGATRPVDSRDIATTVITGDNGKPRQMYVRDGDFLQLKPGKAAKYAAYRNVYNNAKDKNGRLLHPKPLPEGVVDEDAIMFKATRGLKDKLRNVDEKQIIVITCANGSPHSLLLDVLDQCARHNLRNVNVMSFQNNLQP